MNQETWNKFPTEVRSNLLKSICRNIGEDFIVDEPSIGELYPCIIKSFSGVEIRYRIVFEHDIGLGLSDACRIFAENIASPLQITISELTPHSIRRVKSYAIAEHPLLEGDVARIINSFSEKYSDSPAFMDRDFATKVLNRISSRFPSELEWEAAVKTKEDVLFPFGNSLPSIEELDVWLNFAYKEFSKKRVKNKLCGLFFGEWCGDEFREGHDENSTKRESEYVIKGGGAYFWPWQDEEWVWCMCAMRMPSGDLLDGTAVLRPAISIPSF